MDPQVKAVNVQLVQIVKQEQTSMAMAFNFTGTIMVATCEKLIKIWKFDSGQLSEVQMLSGHDDEICCIVFSKKLNWFASGSFDKTIRCWKQEDNDEWTSTTQQKHKYDVLGLILNNNEDQLISCSWDCTIMVWKVNCQKNILEYDYTLEKKHTQLVYGISLNESETALVSCSSDRQIILWKKDQDDKWVYQHTYCTNDDFGKRICFIDNNQIAWQQQDSGILHIFQIENGELTPKPEDNIELNQKGADDWLFPTIVNKQKHIVIQKYNKYVYILQKQEDGKLFIACQPIDCHHETNYGTLTNDGEYLVIWDKQSKEFRVHNLKYK